MRSYRKFLGFVGDHVLEILRLMENENWHHAMIGSERFKGYALLSNVLVEIVERGKFYVNEKGATGEERLAAVRLAAAQDGLDRLLAEYNRGSLGAGSVQLELDDHDGGEAGGDISQDHHWDCADEWDSERESDG